MAKSITALRAAFLKTHAEQTAKFRLDTEGHFLMIGQATCALLAMNQAVTSAALIELITDVPAPTGSAIAGMKSAAIAQLNQPVDDSGMPQ